MALSPVHQTLVSLCARKRIILWDDPTGDWKNSFLNALPAGVTGLAVDGDSLRMKHRVLREEPDGRFVLYFGPGDRFPKEQDLLYDLRMAYGPEFSADKVSMALIETGLPEEFKELGRDHAAFFADVVLKAALRDALTESDKSSADRIRLRMIAVLVGASTSELRDILLAFLRSHADEDTRRVQAVAKHGLEGFLWEAIRKTYGYTTKTPSWKDFAIALLECADRPTTTTGSAVDVKSAKSFVSDWRNHAEYRDAYIRLAERIADELKIADVYAKSASPASLLECESHREADQFLINHYGRRLLADNPPLADIRRDIALRLTKFWAKADAKVRHLWLALQHATELTAVLAKPDLSTPTFEAGVTKYRESLRHIDRNYRKFIYHLEAAGQGHGDLAQLLSGRYVNDFLRPLSRNWQARVESMRHWVADTLPSQREFFQKFVSPVMRRNQKLCVVISDALRYEIGEELRERLLAESRWEVRDTEAMLGVLPSYTQAGMAALLPHTKLSFDEKFNGVVFADGELTQGTDSRAGILDDKTEGRAIALTAEEFLTMPTGEGRELSKNHPVIYVYHNAIDATGDKLQTESKVFEAAERSLKELTEILQKAANINFSNMVVTADHGFLYQHQELADTDFLPNEIDDGAVSRRFAIGKKLPTVEGAMKFTAAELGFDGPGEVLIPKGDMRFRLKGSGSRYVHGGATLQEILIPVIQVRRERDGVVEKVEVELLGGESKRRITTGQITVRLLQSRPVDDRCPERTLRMVFKSEDGKVLSDSKEIRFDLREEDERLREKTVTFVFTREADVCAGKPVFLHFDEPLEGTQRTVPYGEPEKFAYRRSIAGDFDF